MSGETAKTGELGVASIDNTKLARMTKWTANPTSAESAWGDSDSGGFTNRKRARRDCTGTLEGKFDDDEPFRDLFDDGDIVALDLWEDDTNVWIFPRALIQNYQLTIDQDTKEVIGWTASYGADGIYYKPGDVGAPSRTYPG